MRIQVYLLWLVPCFFVVIQFFLQSIPNVFAAVWMRDFHLNPVSLATLSSAYFYIYALMQIPAGLCYDRWSARVLLTLSLAVTGLSSLMLAWGHHFAWAYAMRLVMGVSTAFAFVGMLKITAQLFPVRQFALMIGFSGAMTMTLVGVGLSLSAYWLSIHSWQSIQIFIGILSLILAGVAGLYGQGLQTQEASFIKSRLSWKQFDFLYDRNVMCAVGYGLLQFALIGVFTSLWGVQFLVHTQPLTLVQATSINTAILIGVAVGSVGWGWIAKKTHSYRRLFMSASACSLLLLVSLLFISALPYIWLYTGYLLAGFFAASYMPSLAFIKLNAQPASQATAMAFSNMMAMLASPLLQLIVGYFIAHPVGNMVIESAASYRVALSVLPIVALLAFCLACCVNMADRARAVESI